MVVLQGQSNMFMFVLMMIFLVFFMVIPAIKKSRDEKKFKESLKVGMKVITTGGIHAKLVEIKDDTYVIETASGKLIIEKNALSMELSNKMNK